jgi:hypothetical protein
MITQAKIKNVIADFSGISAAYYGYQDRYRAIPGDDPNTETRWTAAAKKGDGNGVVAGTYNNAGAACVDTVEACMWWDHLRRAGFVSGSGFTQPFNALTGLIGIQTGNGDATTPGPIMGGFAGLIMCSANLPDKIAIATDTQMDDGVPNTGTVRGDLQTAPNPNLDNAPVTGYVENGTNIYVLCRSL